MNFKPFDNRAKQLIKQYLSLTNYEGSDYLYFAYLCWFEDLEYAESENALFLRAYFNGALRYWAPLTKDGLSVKDAMALCPKGSSFSSCTAQLALEMSDKYADCTNRAWSEYVYNASDFISLKGKRYSAKRNHITKFKSKYNYTIAPYKSEDEEELVAFENAWLDARTFESENARRSAQRESAIMFEGVRASLLGETICDVLRVDDKVVGFSVGEIMPSGNAVVMIEKADIAYEGVYSFLAHEFAERNFQNCQFINRQEDMGLEGLRKSKLSYHPAYLLDKYVLTPLEYCDRDSYGALIKPCVGDSSLIDPNVRKKSKDEEDETSQTDNGDTQVDEISNLSQQIKLLSAKDYDFRQLVVGDFDAVMTFLKCGISHLADKKHFLNYTDDELSSVLENGYMLGAFFKGHLVATCAIDFDKEYGNKLASICNDREGRQYFEFSGIMVCPYHQRKGLANEICSRVIEYATKQLQNAALCAVVQWDNQASLNNLEKLGFEECASAKYREYDFKYLVKRVN